MRQLNGTWKSTYSQTTTSEGITVKTDVVSIITITATNDTSGTQSSSATFTMIFSGTGIAEMWDELKETLEEDEDFEWTFNEE